MGEQAVIRVVIVEDSPVVLEFLNHILSAEPDMRVIATAQNGEQAVEIVERLRPDVITMDINMPKMNGFDATRRIMETVPTPIVIVSGSWDTREVSTSFLAMEAGALAVVQRPAGIGHPEHAEAVRRLVQTVKLMAEVKVVRRIPRLRREAAAPARTAPPLPVTPSADIRLVAIGASTGGPIVLQTILGALPREFPVPVLIVQHMAPGFIQGFTDWLTQSTGFPVHVAAHGQQLLPGHAYVAPDGVHMGVNAGDRIALSGDDPDNGLRPSVSHLFRSVAGALGGHAVAVLLTGMGKDGAEALKLLKDRGAPTIVQDADSSVVYGMPGEALKLEAATCVLSPTATAEMLVALVRR